jgi:hypothetical protein
MSDNLMSRRKFLVSAGTVAAAAGIAGVGFAKAATPAAADGAATPWPYPTDPSKQPDPETLGRRAYELYYTQGGCAEATWWPIIEALAADNPTTWGTLPKKMFAYGGGGVAGWGTLCGTCNGSSAIIGMIVGSGTARNKIIDEVMQYYAETPLPTNGIDKAVAEGWSPAAGIASPQPNVPTSTAHSQLCHASLSQWTMTTGAADGSTEQKDRCAKACHDMVVETVTLLNAYFANSANTLPAGVLDPSIASCQSACHSSAKGKMACGSCHEETGAGPHQD